MLFFKSSRNALAEITKLYDFYWPTIAAMWNLRWQVVGYSTVRPQATQSEFIDKFIKGSGIHGVNFKASIINRSWEEQQQDFGQILLTNLFAVYESWIPAVLETLSSFNKKIVKDMQYPTAGSDGIGNVLRLLCLKESIMLKKSFYTTLKADKKNSLAQLDNLLKTYRFFKESRNCYIHNGGKATQNLMEAYQHFALIASASQLKMSEVPLHVAPVLNEKVKFDLRGVVGFSDIVIRIISTCDAELSRSVFAENEFEIVCIEEGAKQLKKTLNKSPEKRAKQISSFIQRIGYPNPLSTIELEQFLLSKKVMF